MSSANAGLRPVLAEAAPQSVRFLRVFALANGLILIAVAWVFDFWVLPFFYLWWLTRKSRRSPSAMFYSSISRRSPWSLGALSESGSRGDSRVILSRGRCSSASGLCSWLLGLWCWWCRTRRNRWGAEGRKMSKSPSNIRLNPSSVPSRRLQGMHAPRQPRPRVSVR